MLTGGEGMNCTRCDGTGFLNIEQMGEMGIEWAESHIDFCAAVMEWIRFNPGTDVSICDCCGDGEGRMQRKKRRGKHMNGKWDGNETT